MNYTYPTPNIELILPEYSLSCVEDNNEWNELLYEITVAAKQSGNIAEVGYPDIQEVTVGPLFTRFAGPCTAGVFEASDSLFLFHINPWLLQMDGLEKLLTLKTGLGLVDIEGGVYGSSGENMIFGRNIVYRDAMNLNAIQVPFCAFSMDWYIDPGMKKIAYHFNYCDR